MLQTANWLQMYAMTYLAVTFVTFALWLYKLSSSLSNEYDEVLCILPAYNKILTQICIFV